MHFSKVLKSFVGGCLSLVLVACGGGGGNPGSVAGGPASSNTASGTNTTGTVQTTVDGTLAIDLISGAGLSTNSISAVEVAQVRAIVKDSTGALVSGTVVTFAESGPGLLKFSPASQTAMTNGAGLAVMELRAADQAKTGATTVSVVATVSGKTITATKTLEITNAPTSGGVVVDPQTLAKSINFISTDPADKAIVLKGAGGNGRTETGVLSFRVVDENNTPVKGVLVDFVVNPSTDVTLNISQGTTDADGLVISSVTSKNVPTSVVVQATVNGKTITTQSDQLKVTTGLGIAAGFEILPLVYNLDGALSGDSTEVTARLVDVNSNPVADGVPVVFVATGGKIGTSAAGGCNTVNGACSVTFEVQNPRPTNGIVTVSGSAKVGTGTTLLSQFNIHLSTAAVGFYEPANGVPAAPLVSPLPVTLSACSKNSKSYMIANALGYSAPAGTTLSVKADANTGMGASIPSGNTVLDVGSFGPSGFDVIFDPTAATNPTCSDSGIDIATAKIELTAVAPKSARTTKLQVPVTYPAGDLKLLVPNTQSTAAKISTSGCNFETFQVEAIGSNGLTLPVGAGFSVSPSDTAASVSVSTVLPDVADPGAPTNASSFLAVASNDLSRQSLWFRVRAPNGGAARCLATGTIVPKTFDLIVTVLINGRRNTQTIPVTYPGN